MLEKPKDFEEAKVLIKSSTTSDYNTAFLNAVKFKAGLVAAVGVGVSFIAGIVTKEPSVTLAILPNVGIFTLTALTPYFKRKSVIKDINNGDLFINVPKSEIMRLANLYVKEYNEFEASHKGRSR